MSSPAGAAADGMADSLSRLHAAARDFRRAASAAFQLPTLENLKKVCEDLARERPSRPPACPPDYLEMWNRHVSGDTAPLTRRALGALVWEPNVALDPRFHYYADDVGYALSGRALQGLVRSCHLRWDKFLAHDEIQRIVRRRLRGYSGPSRIVNHWREYIDTVLAPHAPAALGAWMLARKATPKSTADYWNLDQDSEFFTTAVRDLLRDARKQWVTDSQLANFVCGEVLSWKNWQPSIFKVEVSDSIVSVPSSGEPLNEQIRSFVLRDSRLGDPRLPLNQTKWLGMDKARQRFIEWLSRADIVFFFDYTLPAGVDRQERRPFWLRYVHRIVRSRPLLCAEDYRRLEPQIRELNAGIGNFGRIRGTNSAFLLDFGDVCAVEFTHVGACYVYTRAQIGNVVRDFWTTREFTEAQLKDKKACMERVAHTPRWAENLQSLLATHGIRPQ